MNNVLWIAFGVDHETTAILGAGDTRESAIEFGKDIASERYPDRIYTIEAFSLGGDNSTYHTIDGWIASLGFAGKTKVDIMANIASLMWRLASVTTANLKPTWCVIGIDPVERRVEVLGMNRDTDHDAVVRDALRQCRELNQDHDFDVEAFQTIGPETVTDTIRMVMWIMKSGFSAQEATEVCERIRDEMSKMAAE